MCRHPGIMPQGPHQRGTGPPGHVCRCRRLKSPFASRPAGPAAHHGPASVIHRRVQGEGGSKASGRENAAGLHGRGAGRQGHAPAIGARGSGPTLPMSWSSIARISSACAQWMPRTHGLDRKTKVAAWEGLPPAFQRRWRRREHRRPWRCLPPAVRQDQPSISILHNHVHSAESRTVAPFLATPAGGSNRHGVLRIN